MRRPVVTLALMLVAGVAGSAARAADPTPSPTPYFSVTVLAEPSATEVGVGQPLQVTVTVLNESVGCIYPVYDLTLTQQGSGAPIFDPPSQVVGPPVQAVTVFDLTAAVPGTITFHASAYGERYCNDFWQWMIVDGDSVPVTVVEATATPTPTVEPDPSATPTPGTVPAAGPAGTVLLLVVLGGLLAARRTGPARRRQAR